MLNKHSLTNNPASFESPVPRRSAGRALNETLCGRTALKYRADIDGLRAVAVLSVLAFHIRLHGIQGGFVGVDVFFVISGYLISSIVFTEIAESRYSIIGFYERRIRRIFPALFAMLAVFSVLAAVYLLPAELVGYSKSMLAATASASNFYFWRHSGYFDMPTSYPLLHTWSLAVEEQFYILFPLFLLLVRKLFPTRLRVSVTFLFFVSLVASAVVVSQNRETAFYMPYTRAWELLLGTILSLGLFPRLGVAWQRNVVTFAGMVLIAISIFFYSEQTLFPGLSALAPCVGSALIIGAGESGSSLIGKLLSWRPIVFIGLISYSLYLWHWPIIVLQQMGVFVGESAIASHRIAALLPEHRLNMLVEVVLSFIAAILSWRFVERPFRSGPLRLSGRPLFALAGAVGIILIGVSAWAVLAKGFEGRFPTDALEVASVHHDSEEIVRKGCFVTSDYHFEKYNSNVCLHQDDSGKKRNYLLFGDSHSAMLWSALSLALPNANVMQASTFACPPLVHSQPHPDCEKMTSYIFQNYLLSHRVQGLFMVARWSEKDLPELTRTIDWAKEHNVAVTLFGPIPEYDGPLPRLLAYSIAWHKPNFARQHRVNSIGAIDASLQSMAANVWHIRYISLYQEICGVEGCAEYADGAHKIPMMDDDNHLNEFGANVVVRRLVAEGKLP
ncbi:MAG TPA: acyltransferase family protein [Candidatus Sulfotelmatobacter sp.]|nr:acyltransferase family protein [Candidatus Sulfotelmatobacter sp.]